MSAEQDAAAAADSGLICNYLTSCPAFQEAFADVEGANNADDATWVLTSSFVILTMQSGFGLLEIGFSSKGHEINTMLKNVYDVVFGALAYYSVGYAISFGTPSTPFCGTGDFFLSSESRDLSFMLPRYLFQFSFAATSTTIVSGMVAMRIKFKVYCLYAFFAVIVYSFTAHWVFSEAGWLRMMGMHDFAGGGPVHLLGGVNGLVAILFIGPRKGRFDGTRPESSFEPSSPTNILFGMFMLWWGWIGFNCGSTLGITNQKWLVATRAATTTINSTSGGGIAALLYTEVRSRGETITAMDVSTGILSALVAITPSCACTSPYEAIVIGFVAGLVALLVNDVLEKKCAIDDPVGAIGVHAAAGIWGLICVGLFADSSLPGIEVRDGLFRGGGFHLLGLQLLGIVAIAAWGAVLVTPFFYLVGVALGGTWTNPRLGLRVAETQEIQGMDRSVHHSTRNIFDTRKQSDRNLQSKDGRPKLVSFLGSGDGTKTRGISRRPLDDSTHDVTEIPEEPVELVVKSDEVEEENDV